MMMQNVLVKMPPKAIENTELFLTPKELAAKIGYHLQSVYAWKRNRGMPVRQSTVHGRWTVEWNEFCAWWKKPKD